MTVFKGEGWLKTALDKSRTMFGKRQPSSLTEQTEDRPEAAELSVTSESAPSIDKQEQDMQQQAAKEDVHIAVAGQMPVMKQQQAVPAVSEQSQAAEQQAAPSFNLFHKIRNHKWAVIQGVSALCLTGAITLAGHDYVEQHMVQVYHVFANGQMVGTVSDKAVVDQVVEAKKQEVEQNSGKIALELQEPEITFTGERAFMKKWNNEDVKEKLPGFFQTYPVGMELKVDGNVVGILKDQTAVAEVLKQIKDDALSKKKEPGKVTVLSASAGSSEPPSETVLQSVEFVQKVELSKIKIQPQDVVDPAEIVKKLETGDVQPTKYTVEKGDCVSCIAKKFNISKQVIYENNPWIVDDMIKAGQQLDLTVLQPTLAVRTVEKVVENQEIQYATEYQQDDSMRAGVTQTISAGKNGLKKVTIMVTKVNGLMVDESVQDEEVIQEPVKAVVKRGTKVIKGEGTGKFAWPVVGASISSTFGSRWGVLHKGVDLTSGNKNILASDNAKVIFAGVKAGYGNCIILDHMNGYKTLYGHLSQINTSVGKIVEKGEKIGYMGSTGDSTGVHLHFEVQKNDVPDNPLKYISR